MPEGKRMTLGEFFARQEAKAKADYARLLAWKATPEGMAHLAERAAEYKRMAAADERYAAENPPDPFQEGADAALRNEPREPPDDLSDEEAAAWLKGWDSEAPDDE